MFTENAVGNFSISELFGLLFIIFCKQCKCISLSKIGLSRPRFRLFNTVASIILPMTRFEWPTSSERSNHHTNCPLGYQIDDDVDKCDVIRFDVEERRFNVVDEDDVVEENGLKGRHVLC